MIELNKSRHQVPSDPLRLMSRVYKFILPTVKTELSRIRQHASIIPDPELRKQALASIQTKEFHCQGGSVYAAANLPQRHVLIPLIVAFQTISDYLDNLCDRSTSMDADDFRLIHQSMLDAVIPDREPADYYALRTEKEDGGYLIGLVNQCRMCIRELPGYSAAQPYLVDLVGLYIDLQVYKHIKPEMREPALLAWRQKHQERAPHLHWNEFAAATGSTLGMFMLFLSACDPDLDEQAASTVHKAYFPHVCGLHIMLDYLIDQAEDRLGGDLNFCSYYESDSETLTRIEMIAASARQDIKLLPVSSFHRMIIEGLLALYLSDPKVGQHMEIKEVSRRLMRRSPLTRLFFWANSRWIRKFL
ncbi:tetraprenyl-beta-curcumene synthase family protein [Paenibacillus physcomitrellae]|uniref:Tetraprenyl-beta-curcumene synthase n=1 Tax=Paenibacillus physcomitrellae TaxID=1619311 RepID=A0ABQ1GJ80_9BACL|nr:tetraprenyl-beta-curcumene synthase family protein [Paenibacillus physcomitrellae]GGA44651.1 hypothetical protein GCM10010917_32460 [Paenibacillus physcomitrellae]